MSITKPMVTDRRTFGNRRRATNRGPETCNPLPDSTKRATSVNVPLLRLQSSEGKFTTSCEMEPVCRTLSVTSAPFGNPCPKSGPPKVGQKPVTWVFRDVRFKPLTHISFRCEVPTHSVDEGQQTTIIKRRILKHHIPAHPSNPLLTLPSRAGLKASVDYYYYYYYYYYY